MRATCLTCAVLLLATGPAAAETLYNKDGVQLSATARVIDAGGATCRIREERHSAEEYARLQPNHGQPLDVWRVELVVANYSGKVLDYLSAHLNVESAWPPCDNWDGLGNYGKQVVWTGPLMTIHVVSSVEPGEERREIAFVLAWHEDDPVLGRWNIDYDFAAASPAGTAGGAAPGRPESAPEVPAATATGAEAPVTEGSGLPAGIRLEDTCAGKATRSSCWMEVANQPGCFIWNLSLVADLRITWTGGCSNGRASGPGEWTWSYTDDDGNPASTSDTGELRDGKRHGHWTRRWADGTVGEGPYVDGRMNGHWTERLADGSVYEGPNVDSKRHGHWVIRRASGAVEEGPYVDDKKHGHWTLRSAYGSVYEGPIVDDKKHGRWTVRYPSGAVEEGPYVDDKKHGRWTWRPPDGSDGFPSCYANGDEVDC